MLSLHYPYPHPHTPLQSYSSSDGDFHYYINHKDNWLYLPLLLPYSYPYMISLLPLLHFPDRQLKYLSPPFHKHLPACLIPAYENLSYISLIFHLKIHLSLTPLPLTQILIRLILPYQQKKYPWK